MVDKINRYSDKCQRALLSIREAFAEVECPYSECDMSHEFFRDMREHLFDMSPEEFQWVFPRILEDLVLSDDRSGVDDIVWHLSVVNEYRNAYLQEALRESYSKFTVEQASAVIDWLCCVREWRELDLDRDIVDDALGYWKKRAAE